MKKATKNQVIRWYEAGLTVDEFAPLIPQYSVEEIKAVLKEHKEKVEWERLMCGLRP